MGNNCVLNQLKARNRADLTEIVPSSAFRHQSGWYDPLAPKKKAGEAPVALKYLPDSANDNLPANAATQPAGHVLWQEFLLTCKYGSGASQYRAQDFLFEA